MPSETDEVYWKIEQHDNSIMNMWKNYSETKYDLWRFISERQVCRDCLESMKRSGLIKDYDLHECKIFME